MFAVVLKPSAAKALERLPRHVQERFSRCVPLLAEEPTRARPGLDVRRLRGQSQYWRLRIGEYRGIFVIEGPIVRFVDFADRRVAYR